MSAPSSAGGIRATLLALRAGADAARARIHFYRPAVRVVEMDAEKVVIPLVLRRTAEGLTAKKTCPKGTQRGAAAARERSDSPGPRSGPCPGLAPDSRTIHIPRRCRRDWQNPLLDQVSCGTVRKGGLAASGPRMTPGGPGADRDRQPELAQGWLGRGCSKHV